MIEVLRDSILALDSPQRIAVAFSGGLDSSVLLHALVQLEVTVPVFAIHVNHQLSSNAEAWVDYCAQFTQSLGVELIVDSVSVENTGGGLEQAAREVRYRVFERHLQRGDVLLMAHHESDQVETVIYRMMRGAGVKGLAGIPKQRALGEALLYRPLLNVAKTEIEAYAQATGISGVQDESNADTRFDRNFLRREVLPAIAGRWSKAFASVFRSAQHCRDADELLKLYANEDLALLGGRDERLGQSICMSALMQWGVSRRNHVLREWLVSQGFSSPECVHLEEFSKLLHAAEGANPRVDCGGASLRRYNGRIYCLPLSALALASELGLEGRCWPSIDRPLALGGAAAGRWELVSQPVKDGRFGLDSSKVYQIQYRSGGERAKPLERRHSQTLKKLLQEYQLEPWLRDSVPLVYCDGVLVAVGDLWLCEAGVVHSGPDVCRLIWRFKAPNC